MFLFSVFYERVLALRAEGEWWVLTGNLLVCHSPPVGQKYSGEFCMASTEILKSFCSCTQENVRQTSPKCFANRKWSLIHFYFYSDTMCLLFKGVIGEETYTSPKSLAVRSPVLCLLQTAPISASTCDSGMQAASLASSRTHRTFHPSSSHQNHRSQPQETRGDQNCLLPDPKLRYLSIGRDRRQLTAFLFLVASSNGSRYGKGTSYRKERSHGIVVFRIYSQKKQTAKYTPLLVLLTLWYSLNFVRRATIVSVELATNSSKFYQNLWFPWWRA